MAVSGDDAMKMYRTILKGLPIDLSGVDLTQENIDFFEKIKSEIEAAPEGTMASIPNEWD
ncbi:MAG: hypothetical protein RIQ88_941 [Actinomycetota bacterium]|jgi:hypothetical protein